VGSLYKFGAAGPSRFDCSGYTMYVYRKTTGKKLPHKANSQQKYGKSVAKSKKQIGDLIIFRNGSYGYHAGIYAGSGYMYDSPHTGARVSKRKMIGSNYVVRRVA
jgi:cell wall-associated NlpC family hydrolase